MNIGKNVGTESNLSPVIRTLNNNSSLTWLHNYSGWENKYWLKTASLFFTISMHFQKSTLKNHSKRFPRASPKDRFIVKQTL